MSRVVCAAVAVAFVAGCASGPSAPPPGRAEGPAPKSGYVDVGLASQAAAFEVFTRRAAAVSPAFAGPGAISEALAEGAAYEPRQLEAGMVAYGAMAALQEPAFVAALRSGQGREVARRLAADPQAALSLPGGQAAAARASGALHRRGAALAEAGARVRQSSYTVQRQAWSRAKVSNAAARLAEAKRRGSLGYRRSDGDVERLYAAVAEGGRRGGASPVAARATALAALTVLGREGEGRALLHDPRNGMCLRMAKLNFHQCLASSGTQYEDIYCLGVHAMAETGRCVVDATTPRRVAAR